MLAATPGSSSLAPRGSSIRRPLVSATTGMSEVGCMDCCQQPTPNLGFPPPQDNEEGSRSDCPRPQTQPWHYLRCRSIQSPIWHLAARLHSEEGIGMARVVLGAVSSFPGLTSPTHTATIDPAHAHFGFAVRPLQAWRTAQSSGAAVLVSLLCTPPGVHAVAFRPRATSHPRHGQCPRHRHCLSPGRFSTPELLKVAQLWLGDHRCGLLCRPQPVFSELL